MNGPYRAILADPAWLFKNRNTGGSLISGAAAQYPVMTADEIANLPVASMAADDCVLFMWWVSSQPEEALKVMKAWGFELKNMNGFVWVKLTRNLNPFFGMGFWTRAGSESCLIATRGKPGRVSASVRAVVEAPVGRHSEKPEIFYQEIVKLVGDVPRVELFARRRYPGWEAWGNEVVSTVRFGL